ncbi:hypothetical protein [Catellatospora methionotrophica]|uniref:hypothetical protein n=1 Tax=Catellatospora methionotrophica TaxID=121620 RepID=UPI0034085163
MSPGHRLPVTVRTPLRIGAATVWVDPEAGTVRCEAMNRVRTLLAGLDPASYLIAGPREAIVATAASGRALSFAVTGGAPAALGARPKPDWCEAVEQTLPAPLEQVTGWLEVGVRDHAGTWHCSIPQGNLPRLQALLARRGHPLVYITRIQVDTDDH